MEKIALIALLAPVLTGCFIHTNIQGNGTVTSPNGNFNCTTGNNGDCQQEYTGPGSESFTAEAEPGHTFDKWTGCTHTGIDTCRTLAWNQGLANGSDVYTVTATFKEQNPPVQAAGYSYNALGQRITKTVNGQTTIFQYDLDGKLMAEIDAATGQPVRQHVHVNGEPIAQLSTHPGNGAIAVQYVHADHLGTPTLLTNQSGNVVADIEATPFGETYIDYDGAEHSRRFPGQYKDEETGLHYNYFRDYDPTTGRYIQSDPIGLDGGLNTYAYAEGNALRYSDPLGLWVKRCARGLGNKDKPARKPGGNPVRHDYLSVSGKILSFQSGANMVWSKGRIDNNEYSDNPKCAMVCKDAKFDKYVREAAGKIGAPTYCLIAYPGTTAHFFGARNCQTWANDVLAKAKKSYLKKEECPKCFK